MLSEDEKWYEVSLRIAGDKLDLNELTSRLALEPTRTGHAGEPITTHPHSARYKKAVWIWRATSDSSIPFEHQLRKALSVLETCAEQLRQLAGEAGIEVYWFLGFASGNGQGMATFSSETLQRIGALGIDLVLDLYPDPLK